MNDQYREIFESFLSLFKKKNFVLSIQCLLSKKKKKTNSFHPKNKIKNKKKKEIKKNKQTNKKILTTLNVEEEI